MCHQPSNFRRIRNSKGKPGECSRCGLYVDRAVCSQIRRNRRQYRLVTSQVNTPRIDVVLRTGLGGDDHLAVVLQPYYPSVRCEDSDVPLSRESCSAIERGMEADGRWRSFGYRSVDPDVEEPLPYDLMSGQLPPTPSPMLNRITFQESLLT